MTVRIALIMLTLALPIAVSAADPSDLPSGKKHEGELTAEQKVVRGNGGSVLLPPGSFLSEHTVTLKARDKIVITASVAGGKERKVCVILKDSTGKAVGSSRLDPGSTKLQVTEVAASGQYTILLVSDQIGAYTLKADYPADKPADPKAESGSNTNLQERVTRLEKELAEVKAKLKELQEKK